MKKLFLVIFLFCGVSLPAMSETGNQAYESCSTDRVSLALELRGFQMGVQAGQLFGSAAGISVVTKGNKEQFDSAFAKFLGPKTQETSLFCLPPGATPKQFADVFCKYLEDNPNERHLDSWVLILAAAKKSWPCAAK